MYGNNIYYTKSLSFIGLHETTFQHLMNVNLETAPKPDSSNHYWKLNNSDYYFQPIYNNTGENLDLGLPGFKASTTKGTVFYFTATSNSISLTYAYDYRALFNDSNMNYYMSSTNYNSLIFTVTGDDVELRFSGDQVLDYQGKFLTKVGKWVGKYNEDGFTLKYQKITDEDFDPALTYDITTTPKQYYYGESYYLPDKILSQNINTYTGGVLFGKPETRTEWIAYDPQTITFCV
jgi:hypothetical protein